MSVEEVSVGQFDSFSPFCPFQVDYVVVDGSSQGIHGAARFLVQLAGVPAAIWCGNFELTFKSTAITKATEAAEAVAKGTARNKFTAIFVAHFLGWSHASHPAIIPEPGRVGPTRMLELKSTRPEAGRPKELIPVSLVSRVSENPGHGFLCHASLSAVAQEVSPQIRQIRDVMSRTGRHRLIYISFGSQGNNVDSGESYQKIINQASAVKNAVVLFDLPKSAPDRLKQLVATGNVITGKDANVILSVWPPQQEILATFGLDAPYSSGQSTRTVQTVFWTHCGAGRYKIFKLSPVVRVYSPSLLSCL